MGKRPFSSIVQYTLQDGSPLSFSCDSTTKKQRISSEEELSQLEPVTERVTMWFLNNQHSLPKTEERLSHLLHHLCKISVVVDPHIVYYHLLLNGVLIEDNEENIHVNREFNINQLRGFIPEETSGLSSTLSLDFTSNSQ